MLDLALASFVIAFLGLGLRRPFVWVLAYLYIDIVAPQKISYFLLASIPLSLIAFVAAFGGWLAADSKADCRFTMRQGLLLVLLAYCGMTTLTADFPTEALDKWAWVWKALLFAIFLPLTLRTRLRLEAVALTMALSAGSIIITGAIKTLASGGGYGTLHFFVDDNTGLYEGSIISCVAISLIPVILWLAKYGTIFPSNKVTGLPRPWMVKLFAAALCFACLLIPIGTQARTGLMCIGLLGVLSLRSVKNRLLYIALAAVAVLVAVPFLPDTYTNRMGTIENHESDQSASTRIAVWGWTINYAKEHPLGGGFEAYRSNRLTFETRAATTEGNTTSVETNLMTDEGRAYHSSYFEMLGEQGYPGLVLWLLIQVTGLWQMERVRARWRKKAAAPGSGPGQQWQAPLANALQQAQLVYLLGSFFIGIAYQPFILMLIGLQCGLFSYLKRTESAEHVTVRAPYRLKLPKAASAP